MNNKFAVAIVLLAILFLVSPHELYAQDIVASPKNPSESDDYLKRNLKTVGRLTKVGDYDRALNLLVSLRKRFGDNREIINQLKNVYRGKKDYTSLKALIIKELETKPDDFRVICQLGEVYFLTDSLKIAKSYWEKAFELAGSSESKYMILANYYRGYGFYDEAVSVYRRARTVLRKPQLFSNELSDIFISQRNYREAVAEYLNLLDSDSDKATRIPKQIVSVASESDQPEEIEQVLISAIRENPDNPHLYCILGDINILNNNLTAAFENYKKADRLSGLKGNFIYDFIRLCYDNRKFEMAVKTADYYLKHIKDKKSYSRVNLIKAKSLAGLAFFLRAIELLDNIEKTAPDVSSRVKATLFAGEIYANKLGDLEAAKSKFAKIAYNKRYSLYSPKAKMRLAEINIKTGDFYNASSLLDELKGLEKDKDLAEKAAFLKAEIAFFIYDFKKAVKGYENLVKMYPSGYYVNDCLDRLDLLKTAENDTLAFFVADAARCQYSGHIDSTVAILEKAAQTNYGESSEYVLFSLALSYTAVDMWEEATQTYENYNNAFPEGLYIDRSLYLLAEIYFERLSQPERADTLIKKLLSDYPTSPLIEKARSYLNKIKSS